MQLNRRSLLVSFSQNSVLGAVPSEAASASSSSGPRNGWPRSTALAASPPAAAIFSDGLVGDSSHDQVLRNQADGSTCTVSVSWLALVTRISISSSAASSLLA